MGAGNTPARSPLHRQVDRLLEQFGSHGYITTAAVAMAVELMRQLGKPLLVEGPPGVGKTELARTTAASLGLPLLRLQCYDGLDEGKALYEWKYGKQLLYTQVLRERLGEIMAGAGDLAAAMERLEGFGDAFFSETFLQPRPLLQALRSERGAVLLIDELDKSDEEFEALLLEILSEFQVSIPELGTVGARVRPLVFLTSNNSRDLGEALRRRCLHLYIPLPDAEWEARIITARVPDIATRLVEELVAFVQRLRTLELKKVPSMAESLDWARTLVLMHAKVLEPALVRETLGVLLKFQHDAGVVGDRLEELLAAEG